MLVQVNQSLLNELLSKLCDNFEDCYDCPLYELSKFSLSCYKHTSYLGCYERIIKLLSTDDPTQEQKIYSLIANI